MKLSLDRNFTKQRKLDLNKKGCEWAPLKLEFLDPNYSMRQALFCTAGMIFCSGLSLIGAIAPSLAVPKSSPAVSVVPVRTVVVPRNAVVVPVVQSRPLEVVPTVQRPAAISPYVVMPTEPPRDRMVDGSSPYAIPPNYRIGTSAMPDPDMPNYRIVNVATTQAQADIPGQCLSNRYRIHTYAGSPVSVRQAPTTAAAQQFVPSGTAVTINGYDGTGEWAAVGLPEGGQGWIALRSLTQSPVTDNCR